MNDVRFAFRQLLKNRGFTAVAVLSLALGIGANTAIFSLVNAILLRSLPVPNPRELRVIQWSGVEPKIGYFTGSMRNAGGETGKKNDWIRVGNPVGQRNIADAFSYPHYRALREQCAAQAEIFGFMDLYSVTVRAGGEPFSAQGVMVTGNFFSGLGVRPWLGRLITAEDDAPGAAPAVAIAYGCWEERFGLNPAVLGQAVTLNGESYTVIGVLPREFGGLDLSAVNDFYVPMSAQPRLASGLPMASPDHWWVKLMARMKAGVNDAQFQAALDVVFAHQTAAVMKGPRIELSAGRAGPAYDREYYRQPLMILLGAVGTVLLVACANLAGLSLARGAARHHELAVRAALGAGRWRLIRQSLTESLVLALIGGACGIPLALWGKTAVSQLLAGSTEGLRYDLSLDVTVLGFTLAVALATALLSGLPPALRAGRVNPLNGLKGRAALGAAKLRGGRLLATAQIALSVLLLTGAGLYVRTLVNLVRINPGFAAENLLLFRLNPAAAGLRGPALTGFYERVLDALGTLPGARSAALVQMKLLGGAMSGGGFFTLPAHPEIAAKRPQAHRLTVSEAFFATMEIPIRLGRGFTAGDTEGAAKVVVVNEAFARSYLPHENPVGQTLNANEAPWQIVGVCGDAKYTSIKKETPPTVYFSYRQDRTYGAYCAVRTVVPPLSLVSMARKVVTAVDPNVPLSEVTTQAAVRDQSISQERMFATLCGALAALAVLLACVGLYGLLAYNVARRTGEIGLRMALGATRGHIARTIVREALVLAGVGLALGVPAALALARLIRSQLYGVEPGDPVTLLLTAGALLALAALAAWLPAHRAARVEPIAALRAE